VAAVLGASFDVSEPSTVLGVPVVDLLGVLGEATATGVLAADADQLAFRHEVIREALSESLPPSTRDALHVHIGHTLAAAGAPVERTAEHLLAGTTVDPQTLDWLSGAADRLTARAPALAADLLRRAVDMADPDDQQAGPLRLALADALLRSGQHAAAETVATQTLANDPGHTSAGRLRWILIQSHLNQDRIPVALAEARQALEDGGLGRGERARFHGVAAQCLHLLPSADPQAAMRAAEAACDQGLASGDPHAMAYGLQAVAGAHRWQGRFQEALDLADQAATALQRAGRIADSQLDPYLIRANCLFDLDNDPDARDAYALDLRSVEGGLGTFFLCFHHLSVARMYFLTGRWDDALTEISTGRDVPDHSGHRVHLDGLATVIAVHRQDREELHRLHTTLARPLDTGTTRHTYDDRSWGRAIAAFADGDAATAFRVLSEAWHHCVAGHREYCGHYLLPDLAASATTLREVETARSAVADLRRYAATRKVPALHRSAAFAAGILAEDARALLDAADGYAAAGRPLLEGQAREHAADALAAAGRTSEARQQLAAAQGAVRRPPRRLGRRASRRPATGPRSPARHPRPSRTPQVRLGRAHRHRTRCRHSDR
jgi:tetratricopeptide (TPR) repeat protein